MSINVPLVGCNDLSNILSRKFNKMKARLFNLAETSCREQEQCKAFKAMIKDFVNEAYMSSVEDLEGFLKTRGIIAEEECQMLKPLD